MNTSRNQIVFVDTDLGRQVVKRYQPKPFDRKRLQYTVLFALFGRSPIEYRSCRQRRDYELACYEVWQRWGFSTPALMPAPPDNPAADVVLCMQAVEGETLAEFLRSPAAPTARKLEVLKQIFSENRRRQLIAVAEKEHRLVHYDSNPRNLVLSPEGVVHVDFEMGHLDEPLQRSVQREISKLALAAANELGEANLAELVSVLVEAYRGSSLLEKLVRRQLRRPFSRIHRSRDRRQKRRRPDSITKYDLIDEIERQLARAKLRAKASADASQVGQAVRGSWDGKPYQSLEDDDTEQGRDMRHRYAVMRLPESFAGKRMLDIGCNLGRICIDAKKRGAARAVGIDFRADVMDAMQSYLREHDLDVELFAFDVNRGLEALQQLIGPDPCDYVFAMSIWSHVDAEAFWRIVDHYAACVLYFEDNAPSRMKSRAHLEAELKRRLPDATIEFLGYTTDRGARANYKLTRAGRIPPCNPSSSKPR